MADSLRRRRASSSPRSTCRCTASSTRTASPTRPARSTARPTTPQSACMGAIERTFNVDLVNNTTGAAARDGVIDSSGTHFINLPSPLTSRDNTASGRRRPDHVLRSRSRHSTSTGGALPTSTRHRITSSACRSVRMAGTVATDFTRQLRTSSLVGAGRRDHAAAARLAGVRPAHQGRASVPQASCSTRTSTTCSSATSRRSSTRATRSTTSPARRPRVPLHLIKSWATPSCRTARPID